MITRRRHRDWSNWSGSVRCEPNYCAFPVTLEQVQAEVLRVSEEGERLRVIGSGYSWSPLCWSDDNHLSLARFTGIESADAQRHRVWVRAGTRLRDLADSLADRGWALENMPHSDAPTVGGAIATGTHGSGAAFGSLSTLVTGLRLVCADGSVRQCSAEQDPDLFDAARVSLGALGVVTHVELRCVDDYRLRRRNRRASLGEVIGRLDELRRDHRNVEFYWFPHTGGVIERSLDETREPVPPLAPLSALKHHVMDQSVFQAVSEAARRAPRLSARASETILRRAGQRDDVAPAQRAYTVPRRTRYLCMEYAVPVTRVGDTLRQLERVIRALNFSLPLPIELRFVRRDDLWMSPYYQRDSACIAIPSFPQDKRGHFAPIGEIFDRVEGRPHWGTLHEMTASELRTLYPRHGDFCALRQRLDPHGVFLNPHLAGLLGVAPR
jgi:FAD-linked oxidoreductase